MFGFKCVVMICCGSRCMVNRSDLIRKEFDKQLAKYGLSNEVCLFYNGCFGLCFKGPVVQIIDEHLGKICYCKVSESDVEELIKSHIIEHKIVTRLMNNEK